eukprot:9672633-Alexandrium_andersonii.AAC.1
MAPTCSQGGMLDATNWSRHALAEASKSASCSSAGTSACGAMPTAGSSPTMGAPAMASHSN